MYRY